MKKLSLLFITLILLLSACSAFNEGGSEKDSKDAVKIVDENVKDISLYPAYRMEKTVKKWGFIDTSGNYKIEPEYDEVYEFTKNGIAIVANIDNEEHEFSLINKEGKTVAGPFYSDYYVPQFYDGYLIIDQNNKNSIVYNDSGEKMFESPYGIVQYGNDMFSFFQGTSSDRQYGYMDLKGNIVIPPSYSYCSSFVNDKACVGLNDGKYALINKKGEILTYINEFTTLTEASEGMEPFYNEADKKWGYKNEAGEVVIPSQFEHVEKFEDGLAVVESSIGQYETFFGVIDIKGNFIFKPEYISIDYLGNGFFSACKGEAHNLTYSSFFPKAIFDKQGKQLTDFKFFNVEKYNEKFATCSDGNSTFIIDMQGNLVENMPKVEGTGKFVLNKDLIRLDIDDIVSAYYSPDGKIIWKSDDTIDFGDGIRIETLRYRKDYYTNTIYPQVKNLSSKSVEDAINNRLKEEFIGKSEDANEEKTEDSEDNYLSTTTKSFLVDKNKNMLIVTLWFEYYPIGAAHGSRYYLTYHIDTQTGNFFDLKDLFRKDAPFEKTLTSIVSKQRRKDLSIRYGSSSDLEYELDISNESNFIVSKDCLSLYYQQGEIDSYAAGLITFDIPYGVLMDIIDVDGEMWKAFDKEIKQHKVKYFEYANEKTRNALEKTMETYQQSLVEAINTNDFGKVEAVLEKDSALYNDQKALVANLSQQGIEKKLEGYEIYAINYDYETKEYKLYVIEKIGIKKPQESFETKQFEWCYTAKYDKDTDKCTLLKIEDWNMD
ncbi:MAG: KWG Leptospira [Firmicutes bacterium ADurb.Bin419]|nr:MAG: KWG Leptospira [Firmicutes bacterium ADurb.Bin419]